jgi:hypothetical protein
VISALSVEDGMPGKAVSKHRVSTERMPEVGKWRNGKMTVIVPVSEAELDWLVAKKYLAEKERENAAAIKHAIELFLSASLKATAIP